MRVKTVGISTLALLFLSCPAFAASDPQRVAPKTNPEIQVPPITITPLMGPKFEDKIVDLFVENRCDVVHDAVKPEFYSSLRPLILAVVAYCQPQLSEAEPLFSEAERKDVSNDLIVVLHARYVWNTMPEASNALWRKVMLLARTPAIKAMAEDYLEGTVDKLHPQQITLGQSFTYFANLQIGGSYETNPTAAAASEGNSIPSSSAINAQLALSTEYLLGFGSLYSNYALAFNRYLSTPSVNYQAHLLDVPLALRVGDTQELQVKPFGSFVLLGDSAYQILGGIGIVGVNYRPEFKMTVQGSIFQDKYYDSAMTPQQGTHFHLDYSWEYYPEDWFLKGIAYIEHVSASYDTDVTSTLNITYSHNDLALLLYAEYNLKWIVFGFFPKLLVREDDNDSVYVPTNATNGNTVSKRRQDFQVVLQPNVSFPLTKNLQLFLWYEWNRIFSNLGPNDYVDRNIENQTVGIAIRTYVTSF